MNDSKILALILSLAEQEAIKYGSIGIKDIRLKETLPNGDNVYVIELVNGATYDFTAPKGVDGENSYLGSYASLSELSTAHPTAKPDQFAFIISGTVTSVASYIGGTWTETDISDTSDLFKNVADNSVPVKKPSGEFADSGLYVLSDGTPYFLKDPQVKSDSLRLSDAIKINEKSAIIGTHSNITGYDYLIPDVRWDKDLGTIGRPTFFDTNSSTTNVLRSDFSVNTDISGYSVIFDDNSIITEINYKVHSDIDNVCFRLKSKITGLYVHYFPNRKAWDDNKGGYDFKATDVVIDISKNPIAPLSGYGYEFEVEYNKTIPFLGDGSKPYLKVKKNVGDFKDLAILNDLNDINYVAEKDSDDNYKLTVSTPDGTSKTIDVNPWFKSGGGSPTTTFKAYNGFSNLADINENKVKSVLLETSRYYPTGDYVFARSDSVSRSYWIVLPSDKMIENSISVGVKGSGIFSTWTLNNFLTIDGIKYKAFKSTNKTVDTSFILSVK